MLLRALTLASLLVALLSSPINAATAIPDEGAVQLAGDRATAAMVADVDGDGSRELVRLLPWSTNPGQMAVEVTRLDAGVVQTRGDALLERTATSETSDLQRRPSDDNFLPLGVGEPARLLAWHEDGRESVLVATIGSAGLPRPCCLTLWRVGFDTRGGTAAVLVQQSSLSAAVIRAADLDADGTDELVLVETPNPELTPFVFQRGVVVLRWNGESFDELRGIADPSAAGGPLIALGDSDGLAGDEVGFLESPRFDQVAPTLFRIRLDHDGEVAIEHGLLPAPGAIAPVAAADGGRLALVNDDSTYLLDWPSGTVKPEVAETSWRGGELLGVLGSGSQAAILVLRGGAVDVLDTTLASRQGIAASPTAVQFVAAGYPLYRGSLPGAGASGDDEAAIHGGRLITLQPPRGSRTPGFLASRNIAGLAGMTAIGLLGPFGQWAAVARGGPPTVERTGGLLASPAGNPAGPMWIVPTNELMAPEGNGGALEPAIDGGVLDATRQVPTLLTAGTVTATLSAPAGSELRVRTRTGQRAAVEVQLVGPSARAVVPISEPSSSSGGGLFNVELDLVTPAGHGYTARWVVRLIQHAPRLELRADGLSLSFDVALNGMTEPGARVEVEGRPVHVAGDGSFRASVPGGILPRDVHVRASDQLGNATEESVSVVAIADYRMLPWVPLTVGVTVLLGIVLFIRTPRGARSSAAGIFDEIE